MKSLSSEIVALTIIIETAIHYSLLVFTSPSFSSPHNHAGRGIRCYGQGHPSSFLTGGRDPIKELEFKNSVLVLSDKHRDGEDVKDISNLRIMY